MNDEFYIALKYSLLIIILSMIVCMVVSWLQEKRIENGPK